MTISATPLTPDIGGEITGIDLRAPLDEPTIAALKRYWLQYVILVLRGQKLRLEDLLRVTSYLGTVGKLARPQRVSSLRI